MNIYFACSLTHVPREHFDEYAAFQHTLATRISDGQMHKMKYALVDSDPQLASKPFSERARLCYSWDAKMVREADAVIGECSFPSIGLGIELQIAVDNEIPVILVFRDYHGNRATAVEYEIPHQGKHSLQIGDGFVSIMALGLPTIFQVHQYADTNDGLQKIMKSIELLSK